MLSSSQDTCVDTVTYRVRPGSHECAIATFAIKIYQRRLRCSWIRCADAVSRSDTLGHVSAPFSYFLAHCLSGHLSHWSVRVYIKREGLLDVMRWM